MVLVILDFHWTVDKKGCHLGMNMIFFDWMWFCGCPSAAVLLSCLSVGFVYYPFHVQRVINGVHTYQNNTQLWDSVASRLLQRIREGGRIRLYKELYGVNLPSWIVAFEPLFVVIYLWCCTDFLAFSPIKVKSSRRDSGIVTPPSRPIHLREKTV